MPTTPTRSGAPPVLDIVVGGTWNPVTRVVDGGRLVEALPVRPKRSGSLLIGRGHDCDVRIPEATRGLSRHVMRIEVVGTELVGWVRSASGGTVHLPDGTDLGVPEPTDEDPSPSPRRIAVADRTVVELVLAPSKLAHLVFRVPSGDLQPPPSLSGSSRDPSSVVTGRPTYAFTAAERELLTAVLVDLVVTPPFGVAVPSKPSQIVVMLRAHARHFFTTRRKAPEDYGEANLTDALTSLVRRIDAMESEVGVPMAKRLVPVIDAWVSTGYATTSGFVQWAGEHPEVTADLDFDLAEAMQRTRTQKIREDRSRLSRHGAQAARRRRPVPVGEGGGTAS